MNAITILARNAFCINEHQEFQYVVLYEISLSIYTSLGSTSKYHITGSATAVKKGREHSPPQPKHIVISGVGGWVFSIKLLTLVSESAEKYKTHMQRHYKFSLEKLVFRPIKILVVNHLTRKFMSPPKSFKFL